MPSLVKHDSDQEDLDIVQRFFEGDELAFESLYKKHIRRVVSICICMVKQDTLAEDLAQEAFIQVLRKLRTFRGESKFTTWLHRLTVNQVLMYFRKRDVRFESTVEEEDMWSLYEAQRPERSHIDSVVAKLDIQKVLKEFPDGYLNVLLLHDYYGLEHTEVARSLGISVGTSKSQLHKARVKAKMLLRRRKYKIHPETRPYLVRGQNGGGNNMSDGNEGTGSLSDLKDVMIQCFKEPGLVSDEDLLGWFEEFKTSLDNNKDRFIHAVIEVVTKYEPKPSGFLPAFLRFIVDPALPLDKQKDFLVLHAQLAGFNKCSDQGVANILEGVLGGKTFNSVTKSRDCSVCRNLPGETVLIQKSGEPFSHVGLKRGEKPTISGYFFGRIVDGKIPEADNHGSNVDYFKAIQESVFPKATFGSIQNAFYVAIRDWKRKNGEAVEGNVAGESQTQQSVSVVAANPEDLPQEDILTKSGSIIYEKPIKPMEKSDLADFAELILRVSHNSHEIMDVVDTPDLLEVVATNSELIQRFIDNPELFKTVKLLARFRDQLKALGIDFGSLDNR